MISIGRFSPVAPWSEFPDAGPYLSGVLIAHIPRKATPLPLTLLCSKKGRRRTGSPARKVGTRQPNVKFHPDYLDSARRISSNFLLPWHPPPWLTPSPAQRLSPKSRMGVPNSPRMPNGHLDHFQFGRRFALSAIPESAENPSEPRCPCDELPSVNWKPSADVRSNTVLDQSSRASRQPNRNLARVPQRPLLWTTQPQ